MSKAKTYSVKEIFYSLQGEGMRAGCPSVFLRFAGCNLNCNKAEHGFDCDTDFLKGDKMTSEQIIDAMKLAGGECSWVVITGGEPSLQLDMPLVQDIKEEGYQIAVETNGTKMLPGNGFLDWICVSPKTPDETIKQRNAHEVKFVIKHGDPIPQTGVDALHYILSPAYEVIDKVDPANAGYVPDANLKWALELCLANPKWRLSEQQHKRWAVR